MAGSNISFPCDQLVVADCSPKKFSKSKFVDALGVMVLKLKGDLIGERNFLPLNPKPFVVSNSQQLFCALS